MKKFLVIMLSLMMALTMFTACGQKEETQEENATLLMGMLTLGNETEEGTNDRTSDWNIEVKYFDDLNSMLLALQSGKIDGMGRMPLSCAKYIVARNDNLEVYETKDYTIKYSMGVTEDNAQSYDVLNNAISAMKEDGTLDQLHEEYIDKYTDGDAEPLAVEMPHFDGANTLKVAVTGDVPPLDLVDSDGNPVGYNVAVLAEIAKRAKLNIELIPMNSGSRFTALTSGTVDAVFLVSHTSDEGDGTSDCAKGVKLIEAFYEDTTAAVMPKGE